MARYIDLDKCSQYRTNHGGYPDTFAFPPWTEFEDVAPVVHAHWKIIYESSAGVTDAKCSNCGYESLAYENDVHTDKNCHYCPCCGAKMDEEVETDE